MNDVEFNDVKDKIVKLPDEIRRTEKNIYIFSKKIEDYDIEIKRKELETLHVVNCEVDEDGKKKYTNDKQREYAKFEFLKVDKEYVELVNKRKLLISDINIEKIEFAYLKRQFRSVRILVDLLGVK